MKKKKLDLRRVPVAHLRFIWLSHIADDFDEIIITKEQSHAAFSSGRGITWEAYRGIPLKIK